MIETMSAAVGSGGGNPGGGSGGAGGGDKDKDSEDLKELKQKLAAKIQAWLPDGNSQILRLHVFSPSSFWTMAPLRYAAKFDPFLSLHCAPRPPPWRNPRKGRDPILPSGNLAHRR